VSGRRVRFDRARFFARRRAGRQEAERILVGRAGPGGVSDDILVWFVVQAQLLTVEGEVTFAT
jgi:hypothetical protein